MKKEYLYILGAAAAALYMIKKNGGNSQVITAIKNGVQEVLSATGKQFETGWRYFTDGTSIDPFGNYWKGGQKIWSVPTVKKPTTASEAVFTVPSYDI